MKKSISVVIYAPREHKTLVGMSNKNFVGYITCYTTKVWLNCTF